MKFALLPDTTKPPTFLGVLHLMLGMAIYAFMSAAIMTPVVWLIIAAQFWIASLIFGAPQ